MLHVGIDISRKCLEKKLFLSLLFRIFFIYVKFIEMRRNERLSDEDKFRSRVVQPSLPPSAAIEGNLWFRSGELIYRRTTDGLVLPDE